jgi:hypothetical protein
MRKRIIACTIGALVGVVLSSPVNDLLKLPDLLGTVACGLAGMGLAYLGTTLIDVFTGSHASAPTVE